MKKIATWLTALLLALPAWGWQSDVPGLTEAQLAPGHWLTKLKAPDRVLMSPKAIAAFNQGLYRLPEMVDLARLPKSLDGALVRRQIEAVSQAKERFRADGSLLGAADWARYRAALNLETLQGPQPLRYALVVRRTAMRTFPTSDRVFNKGLDTDLDRFQETGLFPGQALAVLHLSRDGRWAFAQSRDYRAWVKLSDIALGTKSAVLAYGKVEPFLVTTGSRVLTAFNPQEPRVSELKLDMGLRLPLMDAGHRLYGQNTAMGWVVKLPVRGSNGQLAFKAALIPRNQDVHQGYLPFTQSNLVRQAFKFLGERYGWGHDYDGRDCTGFVGEVYRSFGILMPRNTGQQGRGDYGRNQAMPKGQAQRAALLAKAQVGDLLYLPGHVMLVLGFEGGKPWVIHDVTALRYLKGGRLYQGMLNGVSVTPLQPLMLDAKRSYVEALYNLKRIR
ncbi:SH3 domain-containing protein [Gallaecimonas kandeliae]|uniref:SH3 domain-containing protein n=1 Tax=Gallaecimonas kandeliae TaxID=3029055 RepID=UPI002649B067|nr:SH3 domain-containing protein [Gallaecimonas kandeliae]WKE65941.1 SH3 domain-containing protein [Gallaecimonas kandeliae]